MNLHCVNMAEKGEIEAF